MNQKKQSKKPGQGSRNSLSLRIDYLIYQMSRRWVAVFSVLVGIYVALPILAPVLMAAGATGPGRAIYTLYSPFCHQMASRSFFLFGEQPVYPRELAGTSLIPIEAYMGGIEEFDGVSTDPADLGNFIWAARRFRGNAEMGYKTALCQRDIAIYGFVFIGSVAYGLLRKRVKIPPMPIWLFLLVGLAPIALDGFSQLFSQYAVAIPGAGFLSIIFPLRESPPFLRTLTGALFGFSLVWLTYPRIEKGMEQTEQELEEKLTQAGMLSEV